MKIYRANILFTPTPDAFVVKERGFVVVNDEGNVVDTYDILPVEYAGLPEIGRASCRERVYN